MAAAVTPPLTLGEILDRTIQLYRRNFLLFLGTALAPAAFYVLVSGGFSLYFTSHSSQLQGTPNLQLVLTVIGVFAGFLLIGLPLLVAASSLGLSALNYACMRRNHGEATTIRVAYAYAFSRFWRYLGIFTLQLLFAAVIPSAVLAGIVVIGSVSAALLATTGGSPVVAMMIGLLFFLLLVSFVVVIVIIWIRFSVAFPASLAENLKAWPAMQRSNQLTKGSRGRIFVMYLLVAILIIVAYYAMILPVDLILRFAVFRSLSLEALLMKPPIVLQVVNLFIGFLQRAFVMPIYSIALVLFYNDQRTRLEGYDIELLMVQAGWSTQPPPALPDPTLAPYPAHTVLSQQPSAEASPTSESTPHAAEPAVETPPSTEAPLSEPGTASPPAEASEA